MPSRESRRTKQRATEDTVTEFDRKKRQNPILWIFSVVILVIIIITFIGVPVAGKMGTGGRVVFGSFDKKEITYTPGNYLSIQKDNIAEELKITEASENQNLQIQALRVWRGAFERTVVHTGILLAAEKSGLTVSEDLIDKSIAKYGPYMVNGQFSIEEYNETPNAEKFATRQTFKEDVIHSQYVSDQADSQKISSKEAAFIAKMMSPEMKFEYVSYTFDSYPEEEVVAYGKANPALFRKMRLSRITISSSEGDAKTILKQLKENGNLFSDLARNQSKDSYAEKGGDMGYRYYYSIKQELETPEDADKIFALKPGELTEILKAPFGWTIYRCDEAVAESDMTKADDISVVRTYMNTFERGKIEDYFIAKGGEFKAGALSSSFEGAGQKHGLSVHTTDFFAINFGNIALMTQYGRLPFFKPLRTLDGDNALSGAMYKENVLKSMFSLKPQEISDPLIIDDSVVVVKAIEMRNADEEETSGVRLYYPYLVSSLRQEELSSMFLNSKKLNDNFYPVFEKYFLPETAE